MTRSSRMTMAGCAVAAVLACTAGAQAGGRYAYPGELHPNYNPYGPGHYALNGHHVYAGPNCYLSREQVLVNGRLVWRPLSTCVGRER